MGLHCNACNILADRTQSGHNWVKGLLELLCHLATKAGNSTPFDVAGSSDTVLSGYYCCDKNAEEWPSSANRWKCSQAETHPYTPQLSTTAGDHESTCCWIQRAIFSVTHSSLNPPKLNKSWVSGPHWCRIEKMFEKMIKLKRMLKLLLKQHIIDSESTLWFHV